MDLPYIKTATMKIKMTMVGVVMMIMMIIIVIIKKLNLWLTAPKGVTSVN